MKEPKCKYEAEVTEMDLAKYENPDIGYEDHGIMTLYGNFNYLDGGCQGLGYCVDFDFIRQFIDVFGVMQLSKCTGHVWVEHTHGKIFRILSVDGKEVFDIVEWSENCKKNR